VVADWADVGAAAKQTCVGIGPLGAEVGALRFAPALTPYTRVGLCYKELMTPAVTRPGHVVERRRPAEVV